MAARRKGRKTRTRRRKSAPINILNLAEAYVMGSAITTGMFGTSLANFATQGWLTEKTPSTAMGAGNSWSLSASELLKSAFGDDSHMSSQWRSMGGVPAAIKKNLQDNGGKAVMTLLFAPIAFRAVKRVARKPLSMSNKLLKDVTGNTVKI